MKRRTRVSQTGLPAKPAEGGGLNLGEIRDLVAPISGQTTSVTLRLSGVWHTLWQGLRKAVPDVPDSELLRQAVALRVALVAPDSKGQKARATIQFHDESGKLVTRDLEDYVGIKQKAKD